MTRPPSLPPPSTPEAADALLAPLKAVHAAPPEQVARVRARLEPHLARDRALWGQRVSVAEPAASTSALERRILLSARQQSRWKPRPVLGAQRPLLLAAAAVLLAVVGWGMGQADRLRPAPPAIERAALSAGDAFASLTPSPGVDLSFQGEGQVVGTPQNPHVLWERGTLHVEVTPEQGIHLTVQTREAQVEVVGTGFTVQRTASGTAVDVRHGKVRVYCGEDTPVLLEAGQSVLCGPVSAAGRLARARRLEQSGAPPAEILQAVSQGLQGDGARGPVRAELLTTRIRALARAGEREAARAAATAYLASGEALRRDEIDALLQQLSPDTAPSAAPDATPE